MIRVGREALDIRACFSPLCFQDEIPFKHPLLHLQFEFLQVDAQLLEALLRLRRKFRSNVLPPNPPVCNGRKWQALAPKEEVPPKQVRDFALRDLGHMNLKIVEWQRAHSPEHRIVERTQLPLRSGSRAGSQTRPCGEKEEPDEAVVKPAQGAREESRTCP